MMLNDAIIHATAFKSVYNTHGCTGLQESKKPQGRNPKTVSFLRSHGVSLSVSDVADNHARCMSTVLGRWWQHTQQPMHDHNNTDTTIPTSHCRENSRRDTTTTHDTSTEVTVARDICGLLFTLYIVQSLVHCTYIAGDSDLTSVVGVNICRWFQ